MVKVRHLFGLGEYLKGQQSFAMWMSPHVNHFKERYSYNGNNPDENEILAIFEKHRSISNKMSFYEYAFYCFMQWALSHSRLDIIILEVGLGGRFDAVNLFDADLAAVVSISRDHQEILGDKLEDIQYENLVLQEMENFCSPLFIKVS